MPEFLLQFLTVIGKGPQDVLTPHTSWLATMKNDLSSHNSPWKVPLSWHWTVHSGGYWQQVEQCNEMVQAEQYKYMYK